MWNVYLYCHFTFETLGRKKMDVFSTIYSWMLQLNWTRSEKCRGIFSVKLFINATCKQHCINTNRCGKHSFCMSGLIRVVHYIYVTSQFTCFVKIVIGCRKEPLVFTSRVARSSLLFRLHSRSPYGKLFHIAYKFKISHANNGYKQTNANYDYEAVSYL
jgi:hypothetical protein